MSANKHDTIDRAGALVWLPEKPSWNNMILGSSTLIQSYNLANISDKPLIIKHIQLIPGDDSRVQIVGGSCKRGTSIPPKASRTIHIAVNPSLLGAINQTLQVGHDGFGFPLRSQILVKITENILPGRKSGQSSYLVEETTAMDRNRRLIEQDGHRRLGRVNAREHHELSENSPSLEGEAQNTIRQNPWLDNQRFDGVDPSLNPEPPLNSEARREFDNERREQEMEKQLRLGNMPKFSTAPKPQFGS